MPGLVTGRLPEPLLRRAPVLRVEPVLGAKPVLECTVVLRAEPGLRCGAALRGKAALRGEPVLRGQARLRSVSALGRGAGVPRRRESALLRIPRRTEAGLLLLRRVPALLGVASGGRIAAGRAVPVGAVPALRDRARRQDRAGLRGGAALRCGRRTKSGLRAKARRRSWVAARAGRTLRDLPSEVGRRLPRVPRRAAGVPSWSALASEALAGEALPCLALALVAGLRRVSPVEPGTWVLRAACYGTRPVVFVRVGVGLHRWLRQGRALDGGVVSRVAVWIGSIRRRGSGQRTRPVAGQSGGLSWPSGRIRAGGIRRL